MAARKGLVDDATLPRKVPQGVYRVSVPQTDTGG
jgi:hypothetical protein